MFPKMLCVRALVVLCISCIFLHIDASIVDDGMPARIVELTDKTFEHDTQAASGQTTGVW